MNGLIKTSKLDGVAYFGSLAIALSSISAVLYVIATAFTGGGLA
jgi:hypothetical protein